MRKLAAKYLGVLIGALYGLGLRYFFFDDHRSAFGFTDLFSVTFIWVVPVIIGITPMLFASNDQLGSRNYRIFTPIFATLVFFIFCFITRIEDLLCIIIIAFPFMFGAMLGGLIFGALI